MNSNRQRPAFLASKSPAQHFWKRVLGISAATFLVAGIANSQVLTSGTFTISSGAGGSGGQNTSDMISSNGVSWSGGAVGVQGDAAPTDIVGTDAVASDALFKFTIGSFVDSLNRTYGIGNWTVSNLQLTFQYSLYANNSRFGSGPGAFDIYWEANNNWYQGVTNPPYISSGAALESWAGSEALVGAEDYTWSTPSYTGAIADLTNGSGKWATNKTGPLQSTISYTLEADPNFVNAITSASALNNDPYVSLDLIPTSDGVGLTIFTGGASVLPTLTFNVTAVPEPETWAAVAAGFAGLVLMHRRRR